MFKLGEVVLIISNSMDRFVNIYLIFFLTFTGCINKLSDDDKKAAVKHKVIANTKSINWLDITALEKAAQKKPKDVLIMVYATWCEESKRYHNTTYKNPKIVDYINKHYHTALVNAEEEDTINYRGKKYAIHPNTGHNEIVYELKARSIPSLVFLDKDFNIQGHKNGFTDVPLLDELLFQYKNNYY